MPHPTRTYRSHRAVRARPRLSRSQIAATAVTAALVLAALGAYVVGSGGIDKAAASAPPTVVVPAAAQRWCPVTGPACAGYPDPSQVKGITIAALENYLLFTRSVREQIDAAQAWHANAIRLQIVQDKLVGPAGDTLAPIYLNTVRRVVGYALRRGLTVILNAQTEVTIGSPLNEKLPTQATWAFWRNMTAYYGTNPHVVFDLFNEPRFSNWGAWHKAFQPLVDYVRSIGSRNQLWVEGLWWGSTLSGLTPLTGRGIVYSFHHPGAPWPWEGSVSGYPPGLVGPQLWDGAFGDLAAAGLPIVDGEFVNFRGGYYWPRSTTMVTEYLAYLHARHIGIVSWSLQPGIMTATTDMTSAVAEPQGAGRLIWRYYHGEPLPRVPSRYVIAPRRFG